MFNKAPQSETYDQLVERLSKEGHGHAVRRKDMKYKCAGPVYCKICRHEKAFLEQLAVKEGKKIESRIIV